MAREGSTRNTSQVAGAWAPVGISRWRRQVALHISPVLGEKRPPPTIRSFYFDFFLLFFFTD